ncbi:MAG: hypothetical protein C5S33_01195 [ANME-2 cluster archaeon]|jgi:hypothetical protein|nr:hypothetical protein [ANME-2 cluster archaeon]
MKSWNHLVDQAIEAKENIKGLPEEDMYAFIEVIDRKIPNMSSQLKEFLGMF